MSSEKIKSNTHVKDLVITAMLAALVYIATALLPIQIGPSQGGLTHLGNVPLFLAAFLFGKKHSAFAGAIGMSLFDVFSPYAAWAPYTFVIRLVMGYIVGKIAYDQCKGSSIKWNIIGIVASGVWMMVGYYIAEAIMVGNLLAPMASIMGNVVQLGVGAVIAIPLASMLRKYVMQ